MHLYQYVIKYNDDNEIAQIDTLWAEDILQAIERATLWMEGVWVDTRLAEVTEMY